MANIPYSVVSYPGNVKVDTPAQVGMLFTNKTNEDVVITQLGRWVQAGNSQTHTLYLYGSGASPAPVLASVVIDCAGAPTDQFLWGTLASPVTIPKGAVVGIMSTETPGGDKYFFAYGGSAATNQVIALADIGESREATYDGTLFIYYGPPSQRSNGPVSFAYSAPVKTWTKSGTTYTTDGTYYQIASAINDASEGDTVLIPAGTYTWGEGGVQLNVKAGVILAGAGQGVTVVNFHPTATHASRGFTFPLITINAGSIVRDISFVGGAWTNKDDRANLFGVGAVGGWRLTNITFTQQTNQAGYFLVGQYAPDGLIDSCTITGGIGNSELVFTRGPNDSWDTVHSLGGARNIFIEDCVFHNVGYVNDANSNARHVVRGCTINGNIKVDGHGVWSNGGPVRGVRHMEVYNNTWTYNSSYWTAMEIRGGGGRFFNNSMPSAVGKTNAGMFNLTEYGMWVNNGAFLGYYQTPTFYPVRDQIGRGRYATPTVWQTATSEPVYVWGNRQGAAVWPITPRPVGVSAITQYRAETGNPSATFTSEDIIQSDRDYFKEATGFNGSTGVGIGTKAEMMAITPSKTGVGFWVTDEGSWDTTLPADTSGQLYVWNGSDWVLDYVPYTYPHPMRGVQSSPVVTVATGNQTVDAFTTVIMSVTASANPAPTYQWRKDEGVLPGATSSTLTLLAVTEASEGIYDCVVTNNLGAVVSPPATLTVNPVVDSTPPTPNPATFASITVNSSRQITVVATTATDAESNPVEYNFNINNSWTGWQSSPLRYFTELTPSTEYTVLTKSRDAIGNEGQQSEPATATTNAPEPTSPASVMGNRGTRARRLGIF